MAKRRPVGLGRRALLQGGAAAAVAALLPRSTVRADPAAGVVFLDPGEAAYKARQRGFNTRIEHRPGVIGVCETEAGVQLAVARARRYGQAVAIKSGGHSFEGFSSNDGGMVVDLAPLRTIALDARTHALTVGPAATLKEVFDVLLPAGRLLPTGSCGGVGLGGLTLGGGYGLFSRELGLTCDSLTGVRMVTGTGKVVDSADHRGLLWACRGGGNGNFGVITQLRFETHPAPSHLTRHRFKARGLDVARAGRLAETWFAAAADLPRTAFSAFVLNGHTLTVLVTDTGAGGAALDAVLARLAAATDEAALPTRRPLAEAVPAYYGRAEPLWFENASAGLYEGFGDLAPALPGVLEDVLAGPGIILQVNTLGGAIAERGSRRTSAYPHRSCNFLGEVQCYAEGRDAQARGRGAVARILGRLAEAGVRRHYRNYPHIGFADWAQAYYGEDYAFLQQLKREFDPQDRIRHPHSVRLPPG